MLPVHHCGFEYQGMVLNPTAWFVLDCDPLVNARTDGEPTTKKQ
jgi:hypothetical protein